MVLIKKLVIRQKLGRLRIVVACHFKLFRIDPLIMLNHARCKREDGHTRTIIFSKCMYICFGKLLGKRADDRDICPIKGVDTLVIIPYTKKRRGIHRIDKRALEGIGVLILINEHLLVSKLCFITHRTKMKKQVIKIDKTILLF